MLMHRKSCLIPYLGHVKRIWYLPRLRAVKVQASLRIRAVSPEPPLLTDTSSESRGTFRQKARSLAPPNGWTCAVKIYHDRMLEDTNSLDATFYIDSETAEILQKIAVGIDKILDTEEQHVTPDLDKIQNSLQVRNSTISRIEPRHDKTNKMMCALQRLRSALASVQSDQSTLSAWRSLGFLATHWMQSEDSDQTVWMRRLIWVFAGCSSHFVGFVMLHNIILYHETWLEWSFLMPDIAWINLKFIFGPGSDKRDHKGIKVKIKVIKQNERMTLINICWKFEGDIFINNKDMNVWTCVYNAFFKHDVIKSIITFWRQRHFVNIFIHYVHANHNNPRIFLCSQLFCMYIIAHT